MAGDSAIRPNVSQLSALLASIIAAVLLAAPLWSDAPGVMPAAGVILFAIVNWATGALPQHITALLLFLIT